MKKIFSLIFAVGAASSMLSQTAPAITFDSSYYLTRIAITFCVDNYRNGYIVAAGGGDSYGSHSYDVITDSVGHIVHVVDSVTAYSAAAKWVLSTPDGGFLSADEFSDAAPVGMHFRKYDSQGHCEWVRRMSPTPYNRIVSVTRVSDGGYVAVCTRHTIDNTGRRLWLTKLSSNGDSLWSRDLAPSVHIYDEGTVVELASGNLLIVATKTNSEPLCIETLSDGTVPQYYSYPLFLPAQGRALVVLAGDTVVMAGSRNVAGVGELVIVRLDPSRAIVSEDTFVAPDSAILERTNSIIRTSDGGYLLSGWIYTAANHSGVWLLRLNQDRTVRWQRFYDRPNIGGYSDDHPADLQQNPSDGGFVMVGSSSIFDTLSTYLNFSVFMVKFDSLGKVIAPAPLFYSEIPVLFPNPASSTISVGIPDALPENELCIIDMRGRLVMRMPVSPPDARGYSLTVFDCSALSSGLYDLFLITGDDRRHIGKCVVASKR